MKDKVKKSYRYLNVSIESSIHDEFDNFCRDMGMSKTRATEKALVMYMKKFRVLLDDKEV